MLGRFEGERKQVFKMMMVKRDHGQRYNPFDYLYDRYGMVVQKLDGYTYEVREIEKALKAIEGVRLTVQHLAVLHELERRLDNLPKPDSFEVRQSEEIRLESLRDIRL